MLAAIGPLTTARMRKSQPRPRSNKRRGRNVVVIVRGCSPPLARCPAIIVSDGLAGGGSQRPPLLSHSLAAAVSARGVMKPAVHELE